ncbi:MAG: SDR family NAD(P)-dependent oxidoreductase [Yoonia sp.]|uniref:SDR family NAD(P)-dependent oxidoreductase n=1 Tax=Yoonia sp. TaxID=2212373 RepID=UPI0032667019
MENALIIGASGGIGRAVAAELAGRGVAVTGLSRADGLDVTRPETVDDVLGQITDQFDLIFTAIGILSSKSHTPEKSLSAISAEAMHETYAVNAVGPALILKHVPRLIPKDRRSVIATLSARVGSIGDNRIGGWHSYRASKAALNQIVHGAAIELGRSHKQTICVALHPGTVETPFTAKYAGRHKTTPAPDAATSLVNVINALEVSQSGGFFDYAGQEIPW